MKEKEKDIIGYCLMCGEPINTKEKYFVTIWDEVVHLGDCKDEYDYEYSFI